MLDGWMSAPQLGCLSSGPIATSAHLPNLELLTSLRTHALNAASLYIRNLEFPTPHLASILELTHRQSFFHKKASPSVGKKYLPLPMCRYQHKAITNTPARTHTRTLWHTHTLKNTRMHAYMQVHMRVPIHKTCTATGHSELPIRQIWIFRLSAK